MSSWANVVQDANQKVLAKKKIESKGKICYYHNNQCLALTGMGRGGNQEKGVAEILVVGEPVYDPYGFYDGCEGIKEISISWRTQSRFIKLTCVGGKWTANNGMKNSGKILSMPEMVRLVTPVFSKEKINEFAEFVKIICNTELPFW